MNRNITFDSEKNIKTQKKSKMNKIIKALILFMIQVLTFIILYEIGFILLTEHFFEVKRDIAWGITVIYSYIIFSIIAFIGFLYKVKVDRYNLLVCLAQCSIFVLFFYKSFSSNPLRSVYLYLVALSVYVFFALIWQYSKKFENKI